MLSFSANLSTLFTEAEFPDRFARAAKSGFRAVECQFPYGYPHDLLAERLHRYELSQVLINLPAGDWSNGDRGIACLPGRVNEFQDGVNLAIEYARALGCTRMNCLAGIAPAGVSRDALGETFVRNLRFAAGELHKHGITLLIEPLNSRDTPGFFLRTSSQALQIIEEVGAANLSLQFDVYHTHIMEADVVSSFQESVDRIAHVQIADNPGRHQPGSGHIDFASVFRALEQANYTGWIGCEYIPTGPTEESLEWLRQYATSHRSDPAQL